MRRSAAKLEHRRTERTATIEMRSTSGRSRERDNYYEATSRGSTSGHNKDRDDSGKSTPSSSSRRTGSSRTDVKPKHDQAYLEWVTREATRLARGKKDLIDDYVDDIMEEEEKRRSKGRPLWNWTGQMKRDWCKRESGGDSQREKKLLERYA